MPTQSPVTRPGSLEPFTATDKGSCNDDGMKPFPADVKEANAALAEFGGVSRGQAISSIIESGPIDLVKE